MYSEFMRGMDWLGGLFTKDMLTLVGICALGFILFYQIIMTVAAMSMRKGECHCTLNGWRRWGVVLISALFVITAAMTLNYDIFSPLIIVYVLAVVVLEYLFTVITRCKCYACRCSKTIENDGVNIVTEKKEIEKKQQEPKEPTVKETVVVVVPPKAEPEKVIAPQQEVKKTTRTPKAKSADNTNAVKVIAVPRTAVTASRKTAAAVVNPAPEKKKTPEEKLGEKIAKQKKQAEQKTDAPATIEAPYSAKTRDAIAEAEETAKYMDDLQRRVEKLREASKVRDAQVAEMIAQTESASSGRSISEMRREQESLKRQYETLQRRLEEIGQEPTRNYYRDDDLDRGSRNVRNNKYDESEVRTALLGLKRAMEDLQDQIDRRR